MTAEQKLRMRVQELEDLVTEMKQQARPAKVVELQTQLQAQSLELSQLQKKNKELYETAKKLQDGQKPVVINGQDAVEYYAQMLREKEEEIESMKKAGQDQGTSKGFGFIEPAK